MSGLVSSTPFTVLKKCQLATSMFSSVWKIDTAFSCWDGKSSDVFGTIRVVYVFMFQVVSISNDHSCMCLGATVFLKTSAPRHFQFTKRHDNTQT